MDTSSYLTLCCVCICVGGTSSLPQRTHDDNIARSIFLEVSHLTPTQNNTYDTSTSTLDFLKIYCSSVVLLVLKSQMLNSRLSPRSCSAALPSAWSTGARALPRRRRRPARRCRLRQSPAARPGAHFFLKLEKTSSQVVLILERGDRAGINRQRYIDIV